MTQLLPQTHHDVTVLTNVLHVMLMAFVLFAIYVFHEPMECDDPWELDDWNPYGDGGDDVPVVPIQSKPAGGTSAEDTDI